MLKSKPGVSNEDIAGILDEIATLLEFQEANPFRVRAFRTGAREIRSLSKPVHDLLSQGGVRSLEDIPGIGGGLASVIAEYLQIGKSSLLDRLQGEVSPIEVFSQIGGIGNELAHRIVRELDINTLEELEEAAYDGRLARVRGFGPLRVKAVRDSLAGILSRAAQRRARYRVINRPNKPPVQPPIKLLLEIDAEYRRKAEAGQLRKIAPKRFNPDGEVWLPVMHTEREGWSFTVLFSNTALAHELETTRDWVVLYYEKGSLERQATVMTARSGSLKGKRIVRGREEECRQYYQTSGIKAGV